MQLVAYGAQDIYLTANPQITFFKVVYRRHTNFAMEAIEQTFNGLADFGRKVYATIARTGDLIHRMYLQVTLPAVCVPEGCSLYFRWVNYIGHALIRSYEIQIGGQRIDKHYGDWLNIWNELTLTSGHQVGYDNMVGNTIHLTGTGLKRTEATTLYIPLQFWFCRNPGLALPLIALQYHEVRVEIEFRNKSDLIVTNAGRAIINGGGGCCPPQGGGVPDISVGSLEGASLFIDYIYLDTDERRRFAQVSHEYLIEQVQFHGDESIIVQNPKIKLNFNHPTKEIIWVVQRDDVVLNGISQWNNYTDDYDNDTGCCIADPCDFAWKSSSVHTNVESGYSALSFPYVGIAGDCCTSAEVCTLLGNGCNFNTGFGPGSGANTAGLSTDMGTWNDAAAGADHAGLAPLSAGRNPTMRAKLQLNGHDRMQERLGSYFNLVQPFQHHTNIPATGINVYSFALKPEDHQPSGTCNFSRIDNATLHLQLTPKASCGSKCRVYAINYNVLRIMSGMGGLAYAN